MILSVSRRTDIPAFFSQWFMNRIRDGYVYVRNPFNANHIYKIPLRRDIVDCIVFWTKNPRPLMQYLPEISKMFGGAFYFQYTINAYGKDMEPGVPDLEERISSFLEISNTYGADKVVWRYDPILLTDTYTVDWHIQSFSRIFNSIKGHTDTCVISFIDIYDKMKSNITEYGVRASTVDEINTLAEAFSEIVKGSGVCIKTCAEDIDLERYGILHNSCIDPVRIERITGYRIKARADKQRNGCQCIECADIGVYNTCLHGCKYCYANFSPAKTKNALASHNDMSPILTGEVTASSVIKDYSKAKSLKTEPVKNEQMGLF